MISPAELRERLRTWLRAAIDYAWDNPTAEHDARAILVGPKVGLWLGLELLVVLLGSAIAFMGLASGIPALRAALAELGPGTFLISASQGSLAVFLTFIVPLRTVGLLEGPRWRGYLDQLVTTGITPWRYFAGKWATTQPFLLALLAATFPLAALFALLGGCDPLRAIGGYAILWAYGNLLLMVSLGAGVLLHELAALLLVWTLFSVFTVLDYVPCPAALAAWTPHRFLILPFLPHLAGSEAEVLGQIYGRATVAGLDLPWAAWALFLWTAVSVLAALTCALGPLHRFAAGLNNFGAVVLPGDRSRTILRRVRPFLIRRVELAFLFENRGPRLVRWTLPLRAAQQLVLLSLLALLTSSMLDPALVAWTRDAEDFAISHLIACAVVLIAAVATLITGRSDATQSLPLGHRRVPLLALDALVFLGVCAVLLAAHHLSWARAWEAIQETSRSRGLRVSAERLWGASSITLAVMIVTATSFFLVVKSLGARLLGRGPVLLLGYVYVLALVFLPLFAAGISGAVAQAEEVAPELRVLSRPLWVLSQLSPIVPVILAWEERLPPWLGPREEASWLLTHAFWAWHLLWLGLLVPRVASQAWSASAAAQVQERRRLGVEIPPDRRCARCPAGEAVPMAWSWWGGLVGPRLLGYLQCVECGATWTRRTGRPASGAAFGLFCARLLLIGLLGAAGFVALIWGLA